MMYFTVQELMGQPGMPTGERNVRIKLDKIALDEHKRKREVEKGRKPFEYHIDCLPQETRIALLQAHAKEVVKNAPEKHNDSLSVIDSEELWANFEAATAKQKQAAETKHALCLQVQDYRRQGLGAVSAIERVSEQSGVKVSSIKYWLYHKPGLHRNSIPERDWLPSLLDHRGGATRRADIPSEVWELFKADYLRPERPTVAECHRRASLIAERSGVKLPIRETFSNRIKSDIPSELVLLMRDGVAAFQKLATPALRRIRDNLHAMQVVAGDGHVARVFCKTKEGRRFRPTIWGFVDVHSSMIVGYSVDFTENTDMLGIALYRMISEYGTPSIFNFDKGSAVLAEAMTGRMYRPKNDGSGKLVHKKFNTNEVEGVIRKLGSSVNWIKSVEDNNGRSGNSRANPVERLWHSVSGIGQFERDPAFAGAYTGSSIADKPANYGEKAVPIELFVEMLDAWVYRWNHETGRQTEMAKAERLSYAQVFERSYSKVSIPKPTSGQLAMCLLRTRKSVRVYDGGIVELNTGQNINKFSNRYHSALLYEYVGEKVHLRFNPYDVSEHVFAYDEEDRLIGQIPIYGDAEFNDTNAARRHGAQQQNQLERVQWLGAQSITKDISDVAAALAPQEHEKTDIGGAVPGIVEMVPSMPRDFTGFETKRKRAVGHDTLEEDYSEFSSEEFNNALVRDWGK